MILIDKMIEIPIDRNISNDKTKDALKLTSLQPTLKIERLIRGETTGGLLSYQMMRLYTNFCVKIKRL